MLPRQRRPTPQATIQTAEIPAPIGGINTVDSGKSMPATDCIYLYNMIAAEYGLRARLGYKEWCTGLTGAADNTVRTVVPFSGSHKNGSTDKLFACTSTGIWDVTASSTSPSKVLAFTATGVDAGYGSFCVVANLGGRFLVYCDEENGYCIYSESTGLWTQPVMGAGAGQINGVDPSTFVHPVVWKNRLWFTQRDTSIAWYLDVNAIYGTATSFDFGSRMRSGGPLVGLYNWSYDAGNGLDTLLVGLSTAGDVVIYQGTDPASALTFGLKGTWSVGGVPYGRRIATDFGGDLLIMSLLGVVPLSKLVIGQPVVGGERSVYATSKIANVFNVLTTTGQTLKGWTLFIHPTDNALVITVPQNSGVPLQLAMSFATKGWGQYRNLPMLSAASWNGTPYFGTADGRVCVNTGYVDNVLLSDPNSFSNVTWSLLTSFSTGGSPKKKRIQQIRPILLSNSPSPTVQATAKYNWDTSEPAAPAANGLTPEGTWGGSTWDSSVWGNDYAASQGLQGATGMGRDVAIAVEGQSNSRTVLVGIDVMYETGGLL